MTLPTPTCATCDAPLAAEARFCARCGRAVGPDPTLVPLAPLGGPTPAVEQRATVSTGARDRRRTAAVIGVVLAGALAVIGIVRVLADDDPPAGAATPTTTAPTTTGPPTTSTAAGGAVTSTASTTTIARFVAATPGLVLDDAQRNRALYLSDGRTVARIDLGTGAITSRAIDFTFNPQLAGLVGDRLVFGGPALVSLDRSLTGEPRFVPDDGFGFVGAQGLVADGIWTWKPAAVDGSGGAVRLIDFEGRIRRQVALPGHAAPVGFLADRIVVTQFGRLFTVDTDGRVAGYANGVAAAVRGGFVLWIGCDDRGVCAHRLGTATTADTGRTALSTTRLLTSARPDGADLPRFSMLAPDGRTVVAAVGGPAADAGRRLVDLATGATRDTAGPGAATGWTPDGDWYLETTSVGTIVATNVRTGRVVTIDTPELVNLGTAYAAIVVG